MTVLRTVMALNIQSVDDIDKMCCTDEVNCSWEHCLFPQANKHQAFKLQYLQKQEDNIYSRDVICFEVMP